MAALRTTVGIVCIVMLVVGLLLIPFVPTPISLGIAVGAVVLYFVLRALVPASQSRSNGTASPGASESDRHSS